MAEKHEQTAFNDPEAIRLWEEYLLNYVPESRRERFAEIWEQSGSPYRKEYVDPYYRPAFTRGRVGAPDTLHVSSGGGIHNTIAEMGHAYQFTHPELEDIDLNEDTYLDIMKNPPSLDYAYRTRRREQGHAEWGDIPKWLDYLPSTFSENLKALLLLSGYITEDKGRYHEEGTLEHEAHGPIESALYDYYDKKTHNKVKISEKEWENIRDALLNMRLVPTPSEERK